MTGETIALHRPAAGGWSLVLMMTMMMLMTMAMLLHRLW